MAAAAAAAPSTTLTSVFPSDKKRCFSYRVTFFDLCFSVFFDSALLPCSFFWFSPPSRSVVGEIEMETFFSWPLDWSEAVSLA